MLIQAPFSLENMPQYMATARRAADGQIPGASQVSRNCSVKTNLAHKESIPGHNGINSLSYFLDNNKKKVSNLKMICLFVVG
jgi:hypothetical protein